MLFLKLVNIREFYEFLKFTKFALSIYGHVHHILAQDTEI